MKPIFSKIHARILGSVLFLLVLGGIIWGTMVKDNQNENKIVVESLLKKTTNTNTVKSFVSKAQDKILFLKLSGLTEASQTLDIETRVSGAIKKVLVSEGDQVKKGALLAELKVEDRLEKLESAKSFVKLREMQHEAAKRLVAKGFTSPISFADTKKNLSEAQLALVQAQLELSYLKIRAPFSGIVNAVYVDTGSIISDMTTDRRICSLINMHPLYLTIYVTEKVYEQLKNGNAVGVRLADGRVLEGKIDSISLVADPKTRTFPVSVLVPNPKHTFPIGMTAVVEVPLKRQRVHQLNPSWVTLSKEGVMGVMAVENGLAVFYPVTVLDSSPSHLYVSGLPDQ
ncbi:MAG TPA: efflux RND transporter periplasmic adaptor subunit, partial [Bdellovibrionota bacterium]|nr:efflux RND transporter periplasmic adaptor subunit [Bdellovibrionota bacterium]